MTWGPDGIVLKPPDGLGDAETAAICEIAPGTRPGAYRVRFYDKKAALDAIARHLGMFSAAPRRPDEDLPQPIRRRTRVKCLHAGWLASLPATLRNKLVRSLSPDQARDLA